MKLANPRAMGVVFLTILLLPYIGAAEADHWRTATEDRLRALEDRLAASEATVRAQRALLRSRGLPEVAAEDPLPAFLRGLVWGGHVTGSYVHNFNRPHVQAGAQALCQFNCDHETFALDAVKLELGKEARDPGTAGFQLDLLWGANASILGGFTASSDNFSHVQEAYVSYNWHDIVFELGKFETLLGFEVIDSVDNPNITQGILFTYAIPLVHTGLLARGRLTEEIGWAAGVTNGFNNVTDTNNNKGLLGQLSFERGPVFASAQAYFGADGSTGFASGVSGPAGNNTDDALILDFVGTYAYGRGSSLWINADLGRQQDVVFTAGHGGGARTEDATWWGVAAGVDHALSERIGIAVRGEYFRDDAGYRIFNDDSINAYSVTGTAHVRLADNLLSRLELRYDTVGGRHTGFDQVFRQRRTRADNAALVALWEVSYLFR